MALEPKPIARLADLPCGRVLLDALGADPGVWVVGGAARDLLLGRQPREIDLVTSADPVVIGAKLGEIVEDHRRFETVKAQAVECEFDIARTRTESYRTPGALPDVETGARLEDDLKRRDFTINAIAIDLKGALTCYPGARRDLADGVVRVLHDNSFIDDPTRLWRLVRYSTRLGFRIDSHTTELAAASVAGGAMSTVSGDRIGSELRLALVEPDPLATLHAAQNLGLTPKLSLDPAIVGAAIEIAPPGARADLIILGAVLRDDEWIEQLGFNSEDLSVIRSCLDARPVSDGRPSEIAAALRGLPVEAVALSGARGSRQAAERWLLELGDVELEITGDDLIGAGIPEGPEVGRRLARTLALKLDGQVYGRAAELAEALR